MSVRKHTMTVRVPRSDHAASSSERLTRDKKVSSRRPLSTVRQPSHTQFSMNYIRGAVYAISAPYQYYKELPPLNPSTLTGAIDVIVVRRPTEDGTDVELISSPFHVRFGKWQVLRPADKKVRTLRATPSLWIGSLMSHLGQSHRQWQPHPVQHENRGGRRGFLRI